LIAPITGFFELKMRKVQRPPLSRTSGSERSATSVGSENGRTPLSGVRSAPAQNARSPAPVTITARTLSSASVWSNASTISAIIVRV
jgi:hypothetical protein